MYFSVLLILTSYPHVPTQSNVRTVCSWSPQTSAYSSARHLRRRGRSRPKPHRQRGARAALTAATDSMYMQLSGTVIWLEFMQCTWIMISKVKSGVAVSMSFSIHIRSARGFESGVERAGFTFAPIPSGSGNCERLKFT